MKRLFALIMIICMLGGCTLDSGHNEDKNDEVTVSAVWIYFSELSMKSEAGGNENSFRSKINKIFDDCLSFGINTVFVQVRPCCDALYKSELFPWSYYLTGEQGKKVDYDPLQIMVELAHERKLSIHAWINPFRIAFDDNSDLLSDNNPAKKWMNSDDKNVKNMVVGVNDGLYFSPASSEVQKLVIDGVREIEKNYDVDGIHIDDYFYPSTDKKVDAPYYKKYTDGGGKLSLEDWRLSIISAFVSQMYTAVKSENSKCIFSVSPAGNIDNNYEQQYADVKLWCAQRGYADWIIPQIYYGFDDRLSFDKACDQWDKMDTIGAVKMIYGIAAYKVNESDDEWKTGSGIIDRQIEYAKGKSNYSGCAFFSYSSLIDKEKSPEFSNLGTKVSAKTSA